jgi:hypothetical protein
MAQIPWQTSARKHKVLAIKNEPPQVSRLLVAQIQWHRTIPVDA